jgi:hypothetical protein
MGEPKEAMTMIEAAKRTTNNHQYEAREAGAEKPTVGAMTA